MIALDTSSLIAIIQEEKGWEAYEQVLIESEKCFFSAASHLEASMIASSRKGEAGLKILDEIVKIYGVNIMPVSKSQALIARSAWVKYGRGSGHRAGLNFGDCFAYALAKEKKLPLLFKGDDFIHTDIKRAAR